MFEAIRSISRVFAAIDRALLMALIAAITLLVLANVGARSIGFTIAWADELAVYGMIIAGFVGASLMLRLRTAPSVTLLHEILPERFVRLLRILIALTAIVFAGLLLWMCWLWFDPAGFAAAGFDIRRFEGATFNFIYTETTPVMGLPAAWFFLVIPWFALTAFVHAATNLAEDAGFIVPDAPDEQAVSNGEGAA
ncbi:MAG: TRAP transporter small permease [Salinarimonas sp.]